MNKVDARFIAEGLISELDMNGFKAKFADVVSRMELGDEMSVVFDIYNSSDDLIDGPLVVLVNKNSGAARLLG